MTPPEQAAQLVSDLADVVTEVHTRAARRGGRQLLFVLDRDDDTARVLLWSYAPKELQLARAGVDDVDVIAMRLADGLQLLRAPRHAPTIFHVVADQIEAEETSDTIGLCVAHGGFVRFRVGRKETVH